MNQKGVALPTSSAATRQAKRDNLQQKQILVPELCDIHPFPASFWRKAVCIPAILYRMSSLLIAEELRLRIASETKVGVAILPTDFCFAELQFGFSTKPTDATPRFSDLNKETGAKIHNGRHILPKNSVGDKNECNMVDETNSTTNKITDHFDDCQMNKCEPKTGIAIKGKETLIVNDANDFVEKTILDLESNEIRKAVTLNGINKELCADLQQANCDMNYKHLPCSSTNSSTKNPEENNGKSFDDFNIDFDVDIDLCTFIGPSPCVILQALTMSNASDFFNLERLETIGDSFLKFAITIHLYCTYPGIHEGKLSYLRSKQVSNFNLYKLGKQSMFPSYIIASKFEPTENWLPPGYVLQEDSPANAQNRENDKCDRRNRYDMMIRYNRYIL